GAVTAHHRGELRASSRVQGNITAPSLIVHEGAFFEGQCSMAGAEATAMRGKPEAMAAFNQARRPRDIPAAATAATPAARASRAGSGGGPVCGDGGAGRCAR